ncbi:acetolactate synthase [Drepanopeziza brunnea f. sp. 'multigermtubi' MB_m1]|uniref:Acetolactate synthase n=1 Tax=Marssonina brunnea f. sp. multigermtubi (strain MB_m1) TaxID=1072389 RepID=K1XKW0_MARBU|nr:acetolactate synthase [Drepanopeziza brunnea f. sp. 'multigermtubi' MB_m1]EKD21213.1 acetolactate synthase [Drepanopeziza brunnea f. sp. 'multigermtubi' MB_m1]
MYTASFAFFEALWDAGVTHCFVNLGSDHPSIMEAIVKGQNERKGLFPRTITCPNEMVALSMADGFARLTGKPQCVLVHVDVGTQGLGAAVHNASCGRAPVLIFAGLSPFTIEGEMRGSRTEYIHWIQDVPDQKLIVGQYCRYTGEIKTGKNVKQMVNRALQFARSDPAGPVYLTGAREVMEEDLTPYKLEQTFWNPVEPAALSDSAVQTITEALIYAEEPLVICGYTGRNHQSVEALVHLADRIPGLRVLDTGGSDMCFPADHRAWLGLRYGSDDAIKTADVILVMDYVPWINTQCHPKEGAKIYHIDVDPLKSQMPVFYLNALSRHRAESYTSLKQLLGYIASHQDGSRASPLSARLSSEAFKQRWDALALSHEKRLSSIAAAAEPRPDGTFGAGHLCRTLRRLVPSDTIFAIEAVTNSLIVADNIQATRPGSWINCGGGGLGWSGGGALGIKLATEHERGPGKGKFVVAIVGDGTFLFSVPGSVYWISQRYNIPVLTIVLNNKGWNAPRRSMLLVHPDGLGSQATNAELHIDFSPSPDYAGIAQAAAGGQLFAAQVENVSHLEEVLKKAVAAVKSGTTAVVDAKVVSGC